MARDLGDARSRCEGNAQLTAHSMPRERSDRSTSSGLPTQHSAERAQSELGDAPLGMRSRARHGAPMHACVETLGFLCHLSVVTCEPVEAVACGIDRGHCTIFDQRDARRVRTCIAVFSEHVLLALGSWATCTIQHQQLHPAIAAARATAFARRIRSSPTIATVAPSTRPNQLHQNGLGLADDLSCPAGVRLPNASRAHAALA